MFGTVELVHASAATSAVVPGGGGAFYTLVQQQQAAPRADNGCFVALDGSVNELPNLMFSNQQMLPGVPAAWRPRPLGQCVGVQAPPQPNGCFVRAADPAGFMQLVPVNHNNNNTAHRFAAPSPYTVQYAAIAIGCNELFQLSQHRIQSLLRSLVHQGRNNGKPPPGSPPHPTPTGSRVVICVSGPNVVVTPVEMVNPPYNVSANITLPCRAIEDVYIDPFLPELLNIIYRSSSSSYGSDDHNTSNNDSPHHHRTMLTYLMNSADAYRLRHLLLEMCSSSSSGYYWTGLVQHATYYDTQPPAIYNNQISGRDPCSVSQDRRPRRRNQATAPPPRSHSQVESPGRHRHARKDKPSAVSRRRRRRTISSAVEATDLLPEDGGKLSSSNKSVSTSPRAMMAKCFNERQPQQQPMNADHQQPMMLRAPAGVYNRYIPKPIVNQVEATRQTFPPPLPPRSNAARNRRRSSRSSDSVFEHMPSLTDWNSNEIARGKGGRKVTRCVTEEGTTNDPVLRELLDEVKVVKEQIRSLKEGGRSTRNYTNGSGEQAMRAPIHHRYSRLE